MTNNGSLVSYAIGHQARTSPDASALIFRDKHLSYGELDDRANRTALEIQRRGLGPEDLIGVLMGRSVESVVAFLAVWKAGAAYLPLDPVDPRARLRQIVSSSGLRCIVSTASMKDLSREAGIEDIILVDYPRDYSRPRPDSARDGPKATGDNLAYVLPTSGSTGEPKFVAVPHCSISNYLRALRLVIDYHSEDVFLHTAAFSFSAAIRQLWLPLSIGASCIIADSIEVQDPVALLGLMRKAGVTIWDTVPSFWHHCSRIASELKEQTCRSLLGNALRLTLLTGEPLPWVTVRFWRDHLGLQGRVINLYSQTETCGTVCTYDIPEEARESSGHVPLGRPVPGTDVFVLDSLLNQVGVGQVGEIYVGGDRIARGYYRQPSLTEERFIPDPFNPDSGRRLYRTGDLGSWTHDGTLLHKGRADARVKVRGYRVELEEVESALRDHPDVDIAAVAVREDIGPEAALVAYVVPLRPDLTGRKILAYLNDRLPQYMVPSLVVFLENLPLNAHGKIDRQALPPPTRNRGPDLLFTPPRTETERELVRIFSEVVRGGDVGVHDNLFELGADSLTVSQLVVRIRSKLNAQIPLRAVFEWPTVAELAPLVSAQMGNVAPLPAFSHSSRDQPLPLSFPQQRLWFLAQIDRAASAYNAQIALRFSGSLDEDALRKAITRIVRRHEVLRSVFPEVAGEPRQVVLEETIFDLTSVDLENLPANSREQDGIELLRKEAVLPFELRTSPPIRAVLVHLGPDTNLFGLTIHHIAFDGWSRGRILEELSAFYLAAVEDREFHEHDLPVQYADFAVWQRTYAASEASKEHIAYWLRKLSDIPAILALPTDRPRPSAFNFRGDTHEFTIPPGLTERFREIGREHNATLFMALLAAFKVLLYTYTDQSVIVVGSPVAGRSHFELEPLVGCFVNMLVLRSDLEPNLTFAEVIRQIRETVFDAHAHQDAPFERLVQEIGPTGGLSHHPVFQVAFVVQNPPTLPPFQGLSVEQIELKLGTAKFDLTLTVTERLEGLQAALEYNTDIFDKASIRRMADHYITLASRFAESPAAKISEVSVLTEDERNIIQTVWNHPVDGPGGDVPCVHELVELQAVQCPAALAVTFGERGLTYKELNVWADQLASVLAACGVAPEVPVGICMHRSESMIVSMLAVLKVGGAYLPLDPNEPNHRLDAILGDSNLRVVIGSPSTRTRFAGKNIVFVDAASKQHDTREGTRGKANLGNLAYIIYTSGSTGRPKGVQIEHYGLSNLVKWHIKEFKITAHDRASQVSRFTFDASTWEIWPYLAAGASVHIVEDETVLNPVALRNWLGSNRITVAFVPTPVCEQLFVSPWPKPTSLRLLLTGGDRLTKRPPKDSPFTLVNNYGPTECTVVATSAVVSAEPNDDRFPSIGRPIKNIQAYIMDRSLNLLPVGIPGELCLAGVGLSRGYLDKPGLTAERFVPHPFAAWSSERLYRTGDLARWLPDGSIEFLGRADHQVKIRGFRIELGEVEAALRQHPGVHDTVVTVRDEVSGLRKLVAYIVPASRAKVAPSDLRAYLKSRLPEYMQPAAFVVLETLPLTPHGKVNRAALPPPNAAELGARSDSSIHYTPTEELLVGIWAKVFGVASVGIHENFFDLGGHSLLAVQVSSRIRETFGVDLSIRTMFESPTISELADRIAAEVERGRGVK